MASEAYVFVKTANPVARAACEAIRRLPGVVRADALFGGPAVVAIVRGRDLTAVDAVVDAVVSLPMVAEIEAHIVRPIR